MASYTSFQIKTKDVSERKGFLSKIFRIRFEFGESDVQPYDVVAKIPISSKLTQITGDENSQYDSVKDQMIMAVHNVECEFYSCHHVENLRIPKTFFCQKFEETEENQGAIIMEYQANAVSLPLHQSYSFPQLRALAEQIALLQAYSLSISLECFPNPSLPEEIIDFYSDLLREGCDYVSEENSKLTEAYLRLKPLFTSKHSLKRLSCELSECLGITRVLAHGDLWNNNLMWKLNEDGSCSDELACILDWQTLRFGGPGEDIGRMLIVGADPEVRHKAEEVLFNFYYETLVKMAAEQNIAVPFKVEDVITSYQCSTVLQAVELMFFLSKLPMLYKSSNSEEQVERRNILFRRVLVALEDAYKNAVCNNMFEWPQEET